MGRVQPDFGARVRAERTARGWSMKHLAASATKFLPRDVPRIDKQKLYRIETCGQHATVPDIRALAKALGLEIGDLMGERAIAEEPAAS